MQTTDTLGCFVPWTYLSLRHVTAMRVKQDPLCSCIRLNTRAMGEVFFLAYAASVRPIANMAIQLIC